MADQLKGIQHPYTRTLGELLSLIVTLDPQVIHSLLEKIEAISVEGVDPDWQIAELQKIVDKVKHKN